MKLTKLQHYPVTDWSITFTAFSKKDFESFLSLIKNLGFKRNLKTEKEMAKLVYKQDYLEEKVVKTKYSQFHTCKDGEVGFLYSPQTNFFTITFKHKFFDGEDFASLIFSN